VLFGPFPPYFIERLRSQLEAEGATCQVFSSKEAHLKYQDKVRARGISEYPAMDGQADLLFIEIADEHLLIVKGELERMGVVLVERDFDPELGRGEYLCPKCSHLSPKPGLCPKHQVPLLEFSSWAAIYKGRREKILNWSVILFILGIAALILWSVLKGKFAGH
jgi:hypothetical protein